MHVTEKAQIHRFHEYVALYLGAGETTYLTPAMAKEIGAAMLAYAHDCESVEYSQTKTATIEWGEDPLPPMPESLKAAIPAMVHGPEFLTELQDCRLFIQAYSGDRLDVKSSKVKLARIDKTIAKAKGA